MTFSVASKLVSMDLGFGCLKAAVWTGEKDQTKWCQPSIVGNARRLHDADVQDSDVRYYVQHKEGNKDAYRQEHFVGDLAVRHSDVKYFSTKRTKAETWTSVVLLQTALGILAPKEPVNVVSGLPFEFFFAQKAGMEQLITSLNSKNGFALKVGHGPLIEAKPCIKQVKLVPQAFAAGMDFLLNDKGEIVDRDLAKRRILVSDWGRFTWDVLILEGMEISKGSFSRDDLGIEAAYKLLRRYLMEHIGSAPPDYAMDTHVLTGQYEGLDITPLVIRAFKAVISQMQMVLEGLNMNFHKALLVGGQAEAQYEYLGLDESVKEKGGQFSNMNGYGKIGVRTWGSNSVGL